jgi:glycosyltransferase involved in cell wall biosynthesis
MNKYNILVICPSPKGTAATQRLKYEQYFPLFEKIGYKFIISSFQSYRFWNIIYKPGNVIEKFFWTIFGYFKRFFDILRSPFYDAVFINLWVTPFGYPIFEYLICLTNKNIIYDIDDMIFLKSEKKNLINILKGKNKSIYLMRNSKYVITCTPALENYAKDLNKYGNVIDISSTFDTKRFIPVKNYENKNFITIGWTGTHSTLQYLEILQPALEIVAKKRNITLLVIANKEYKMKNVNTEFRFWNEENEVKDLHDIEIGLYPIPENQWSLGKSSLKALTYMSIAIPVVATAYGTNFRIIENGSTGFLVSTKDEWVNTIINLIDDIDLRKNIGLKARKVIEDRFSIDANFPNYLKVFNTVINLKK